MSPRGGIFGEPGPTQDAGATLAADDVATRWRGRLLVLLALGLFTAASLPILPVWGDACRLFAIAVLVLHPRVPRWLGVVLGLTLVGLMLLPMAHSHAGLLVRPLQYVADAVHYVMGYPLNLAPAVQLLVVDSVLFAGLGFLCWRDTRGNPMGRYVLVVLVLFGVWLFGNALWSLYDAVRELSTDAENATLLERSVSSVMAASAIWYAFILTAFLVALLVKTERDRTLLLSTIGLAMVFQALIALAQMAVGDWAYILEFPDGLDYIRRVRGAYYYHGSLDLFLTIGLFVMVSLTANVRRKWLPVAGFAILACTLALNSTRALSVGICLGAVACLICFWRVRASLYRPMIVALILVIPMFASLVFYDKAERKIEGDGTSVEMLAQTNVARFDLAGGAIKAIEKQPLSGYGPSCVIPLSGRVLGGERCTDSSHVLLVDAALMLGIPAPVLLFLFFAGIGGYCLWRVLFRRDPCGLYMVGVVGMVVMLSIATLFFPKERDWNLLMVFAILALAVCAPNGSVTTGERSILVSRWGRVGIALSALASILWVVLTSPTYTMPLTDFLRARALMNAQHVPQVVYSNSGLLTAVGRFAFSVMGNWIPSLKNVAFRQLRDNGESLDLPTGSWVFWSGAHDSAYPNLVKSQRFNFYRPYGLAPSFNLPYGWEIVRSSSPAVSLLRVGSSPYVAPLGLDDVLCGKVRDDDVSLFGTPRDCAPHVPVNELSEWRRIAPVVTQLQFKLSDSQTEAEKRSRIQRQLTPVRHTGLEFDLIYQDGRSVHIDEDRGIPLAFGEGERLKAVDMTMRVNAPYIRLESGAVIALGINLARPDAITTVTAEGVKPAPVLGDEKATTSWTGRDGDQIVIDARRAKRASPFLYEIMLPNYAKPDGKPPVSWVFEGSNDGQSWVDLDRRSRREDLTIGATEWYALRSTPGYDYYRFTLTGKNKSEPISVSGVKLYTEFSGNPDYE